MVLVGIPKNQKRNKHYHHHLVFLTFLGGLEVLAAGVAGGRFWPGSSFSFSGLVSLSSYFLAFLEMMVWSQIYTSYWNYLMLDRVTIINNFLVLRWTGLVLASTAFAADDLEKARLWRLYVEKKHHKWKTIFGSIIEVTTPWFLLWFVWWLRQQTLVHRGGVMLQSFFLWDRCPTNMTQERNCIDSV